MSMKLKTESREQQSPEDKAGGNFSGREAEELEDLLSHYWLWAQWGPAMYDQQRCMRACT